MIEPRQMSIEKEGGIYVFRPGNKDKYGTRYPARFCIPFDGSIQAVGYNPTPHVSSQAVLYGRGDTAKFDRAGGLFGALTNLIANPSVETNTTGWAALGTASLTRVTDYSFNRTYSLRYLYTSGSTGLRYELAGMFAINTTYTFTGRVKKGNGQALNANSFDCYINYGVGGTVAFDSVVHEYDGWYKCKKTFTTGPSVTQHQIGFGNVDDADLRFDGWCLTATDYEVPYFDGASGTGFSWVSTADGSQSSKVAVILFYTTPTLSGSARTIGFWLRAGQVGAGTVWDATTGTADKISLVSGKMQFYSNGSGIFAASNTVTANTWEHWAFTFQGSAAKLYKNGVEIDSALSTFPSLGTSMRIGQTVVPDDRLNGYLDDFFIADSAFSSDQILAIYNQTRPLETVCEFPRSAPLQFKLR